MKYRRKIWRKLRTDFIAVSGIVLAVLLLIFAGLAPLLANARPLLLYNSADGSLSLPFLRYIFAPDTTEVFIEQVFNFFLLLLVLGGLPCWLWRKKLKPVWRWGYMSVCILGLLAAFMLTPGKLDKTDYRQLAAGLPAGSVAIFAPIPYGPYELIGKPYAPPGNGHIFGTDQVGRDVAARMLYGSRVSLAVGLGATLIAIVIGTLLGLCCGYCGGWLDLAVMRIVEIFICFPTFLLLLILMAIFQDYKFQQSILVVILVIGFTGWIGVCQLVRGEVLKQRAMAYIQSAVAAGVPVWRILLVHLLPNISAPIIVTFTFSVAGAIMAESTLSFLGFGVQPPTASWGGLLRQAFENPFHYWHLTLIPGAALFLSICAFNFTGEGLQLVFNPKKS